MRTAEFVIEMARTLCDVEIPAFGSFCNIHTGRFTTMFKDDFDMGIDYDMAETRDFMCNNAKRLGYLRSRLVTNVSAPAFDWLKAIYKLLCDFIALRDKDADKSSAVANTPHVSKQQTHMPMMLSIAELLSQRCVRSQTDRAKHNLEDSKRIASFLHNLCERFQTTETIAQLQSDADAIGTIVDAMASYDKILRTYTGGDEDNEQDHPYGALSVSAVLRCEGGRELLDSFACMLRQIGPCVPHPMQQALHSIGRGDTIVDWSMMYKNATDQNIAEQLLVVWVHKNRTVRIAIEQCRSTILRHIQSATYQSDAPQTPAFLSTLHPPEAAPPSTGITAPLPYPMHCALNAPHIVTVKFAAGITRSHMPAGDEAAARLCALILELISRGEFDVGAMHRMHARAFSDFFYTESSVIFHYHRGRLAEYSLGQAFSLTKKELVAPLSQFTQAVNDACSRIQQLTANEFQAAALALACIYGYTDAAHVDEWIRLKMRADIQKYLDYKNAQNDDICMRKAVLLALHAIHAQRHRAESLELPKHIAVMTRGV
jgi:hypothetical protein